MKFEYIRTNLFEQTLHKTHTMALVVALVGEAGAGKDSIADVLTQKFDFERLAFASPLKKACKEVFGLTDKQLHDRDEKEKIDKFWHKSPRELFQQVGTLMKQVDEDVWLNSLLRHADALVANKKDVVVTDCRYKNEEQALRDQYNAIIVRVIRADNTAGTAHCEHTSETEQHNIRADFTVCNDGTLQDLQLKVSALMLEIIDK